MKASNLEKKFKWTWKAIGGPALVEEYKFHEIRRWRFDFCHQDSMVAVEMEGGIWVMGAHTRGKHFQSDAEKYNTANLDGWTVFRLTTDMVNVAWLTKIKNFIQERISPVGQRPASNNTDKHVEQMRDSKPHLESPAA